MIPGDTGREAEKGDREEKAANKWSIIEQVATAGDWGSVLQKNFGK